MLLINCPHCGERAQTEFAYFGEAHIARPETPEALSDAEWADYVFLRTNPKGVHFERWMHAQGCRRFFNMMRDTVSGEIFATYPIGEDKPAIPPAAAKPQSANTTQSARATKTIGKSKPADSKVATSADNKGKSATAADNNKPAADNKVATSADSKGKPAAESKGATSAAGSKTASGGNTIRVIDKSGQGDNDGRGKDE